MSYNPVSYRLYYLKNKLKIQEKNEKHHAANREKYLAYLKVYYRKRKACGSPLKS